MSHSVCSSTHVFLTLISTQSIGIWTSFGSFLAHGVFKLWDYYLYYAAVVFIKQLHVSQINECLLFLVPLFRVPLYFYCLMCFFYRRTCVVPPHDLWSLTCHSKCKKLYALCSVGILKEKGHMMNGKTLVLAPSFWIKIHHLYCEKENWWNSLLQSEYSTSKVYFGLVQWKRLIDALWLKKA